MHIGAYAVVAVTVAAVRAHTFTHRSILTLYVYAYTLHTESSTYISERIVRSLATVDVRTSFFNQIYMFLACWRRWERSTTQVNIIPITPYNRWLVVCVRSNDFENVSTGHVSAAAAAAAAVI